MRVFDWHCDTATHCCDDGHGLDDPAAAASVRECAFSRAQCFALFIHDERNGESGEEMTARYLAFFEREAERFSRCVSRCRTASDIERAWDEGKTAALLTLENGAAFSGKLENIAAAARAGVKSVGLTWNGENELAYGVGCGKNRALKPFGREAVAEIRRLGMAVDVSHLCDAGIEELLSSSEEPIIATHSNLRSVCAAPRNLPEPFFCEIAARGGIAGLNLYTEFLGGDPDSPSALLRHIDRMLELGGENALCLGCDMDGAELPGYCRGVCDFPKLYACFCDAFGEAQTEKIFWQNALAFFRRAGW